jgi:hypothetical protein
MHALYFMTRPRWHRHVVIAVGMLTLPMRAAVDTNFYILLFIGQSNMVGLNNSDPEDLDAHPRVFKLTTNGTWQPGACPIQGNSGTGPARTCGNYLANVWTHARVGLVSRAVSGSEIASWRPGQPNYDNALAAARAAATSGVIRAVFWHQGEADGSNGNYAGELAQLIATLRADLGIPDLPFIMGQVGISGTSSTVNDNIARVANSVPFTAMASCQGMVLKDNVHYDAASQRAYGERYARAYLDVIGAMPSNTLWFGPSRLPRARRNAVYTHAFTSMGASNAPLVWTVHGSLASGLSLTNGVLYGVPTANGTRAFSLLVSNGNNSVVQPFAVRVEDYFPTSKIEILNSTVPYGIVGEPYREQLHAYAEAPPVTWQLRGDSPLGLFVSDGVLSNATGFNAPGHYSFSVEVSDSNGWDSQSLVMDVFELYDANAVVNFHGVVPTTASKLRTPQVVDGGTAYELPFDDTAGGQLFGTDDMFGHWRGGLKVQYGGPVPPSLNYAIRLNDSGAAPNTFYVQASATYTSVISAVFVWPSNSFAAIGNGHPLIFGNTPDTAKFRTCLTSVSPETRAVHFIAREGGQYYISEQAFSGVGVHELTNFVDSYAPGARWARFEPVTWPLGSPLTGLAFTAQTFTNLTAVGLWYRGERRAWAHDFGFNVFTVHATAIPEPCVVAGFGAIVFALLRRSATG